MAAPNANLDINDGIRHGLAGPLVLRLLTRATNVQGAAMKNSTAQITTLLQAWRSGDISAQKKLWPIVFAELKRLARRQLANERPDHTLQSGALVNEAYLRL